MSAAAGNKIADVALAAPAAHAGAGDDASSSATLSGHKRKIRDVSTAADEEYTFAQAMCVRVESSIRNLVGLTFSRKDWFEGGGLEKMHKRVPSPGSMKNEVKGVNAQELTTEDVEELLKNCDDCKLSERTRILMRRVMRMVSEKEDDDMYLFTNFHGDKLSGRTRGTLAGVIKMLKEIHDLHSRRAACRDWCEVEDAAEEDEAVGDDVPSADAASDAPAAAVAVVTASVPSVTASVPCTSPR